MSALAAREPRTRTPARAAGLGRSLIDRPLTLIVGLGAAAPILTATARALVDGWKPAGDQAIIATRAFDVLTSRTPLIGQYSDSTAVTHHTVRSLGPMLYWLLALPAHFAAPGALTLTIGLVNTAASVGVVTLARRRGGLPLMFAGAIALVLMCRSLAPEVLHDVWNPSAGLLPFTLLVFLCWSVACGEHRLLPITALVGSFVIQLQLTYLLPSLGLLLIALAGLIASRIAPRVAARRDDAPGGDPPDEEEPAGERQESEAAPDGRVRWWALAAVLVVIACWTPPVIDQLTESPGNFTAVVRTATASTHKLGASVGWHAVVRAIGLPPWWLTNPPSPWQRKFEVRSASSSLATVSSLVMLAALLAAAVLGLFRRRPAEWSGALIALVLCAGLAANAGSTPDTHLLSSTLGYTLWWGSPAGMFVWLILGFSIASMLAPRIPRPRSPALLAPALAAAGVASLAVVAAAVASGQPSDFHLPEYRPLGAMYAALDRGIPPGRTVRLLSTLGNETFRFKMAARFALRRRGIHPLSPGTDTRLGSWYELGGRRYDCTVDVKDGNASPARHSALLARFVFSPGPQRFPISVWVSPAGCPRGVGRPGPSRIAGKRSSS